MILLTSILGLHSCIVTTPVGPGNQGNQLGGLGAGMGGLGTPVASTPGSFGGLGLAGGLGGAPGGADVKSRLLASQNVAKAWNPGIFRTKVFGMNLLRGA